MEYTLGFIFSLDKKIILINKQQPSWISGTLNAIGGKIEDGELSKSCMIRECYEETGLKIKNWCNVGLLNGVDWQIHLYKISLGLLSTNIILKNSNEGCVDWYDIDNLPINCVYNLNYLIPAIYKDMNLNTINCTYFN